MKTLLLLLLVTLPLMGFADSKDSYPFEDPQQQILFQNLTETLRCVVCQNQNLADSNAPVAKDLRNKVYHLVKEGKSEQAIKDYLVERYGDFILFQPPLKASTWLLWLAPFVLVLIGFTVLCLLIINKRKTA